MIRRGSFAVLFALVLGGASAQVYASTASDKAEHQQELTDLRGKIDALKKELAAGESDRKEAADALKQSETAISKANRVLTELSGQRALTESELARLEADIAGARQQIRNSQNRIAELLVARYKTRQTEAWRLVLNREDPNQARRDLTYYRYLAQAQERVMQSLERQLDELNRLAIDIRNKNAELLAIASEKAAAKHKLESEQAERQQVLAQLNREISQQRNQIEKLQGDEKRLTQLVAKLERIIKQQEAKRAREAARRAAVAKAAAERAAKAERSEPGSTPAPKREEPVRAVNKDLPDASQSGRRFASLKGKLRLPVAGAVTGRFGQSRVEGTTWKGVFIRASSGQSVHAVASGEVVFADWLRGFGNLIIVDHGDGYMSLYAANESLLKDVGATVKAGDVIATSGNSGGMPESGVYFEIRKNGQPQDPLGWTS
ncbi:murein hydrolase activator EnvC family protein [Chitinibacteraceae bacterium HSL-7]